MAALNRILSEHEIASDIRALTNSQARYLLTFRDVDSLRTRIAAAKQAGKLGAGPADFDSQGRQGLPADQRSRLQVTLPKLAANVIRRGGTARGVLTVLAEDPNVSEEVRALARYLLASGNPEGQTVKFSIVPGCEPRPRPAPEGGD